MRLMEIVENEMFWNCMLQSLGKSCPTDNSVSLESNDSQWLLNHCFMNPVSNVIYLLCLSQNKELLLKDIFFY